MDPKVPRLLSDIQSFDDNSLQDENARRALLKLTTRLSTALQDPGQIVDKFNYAPLDSVLVKIAVDLKLFEALAVDEKPKTLSELTQTTKADPELLGRVMRGLASIDAVEEIDVEVYGLTKISRAFLTQKGVSGTNLFHDLVQRGWHPLPEFLAETNYQNPTDPAYSPFNKAFGGKPFFETVPHMPKVLESFNKYLSSRLAGHTYWLDFYPFEQDVITGFDRNYENATMIVDMGGSVGHELVELRKRFPSLPGRTILQDLPKTIEMAGNLDGIEKMTHDFFTPQPVIGARAYFMRNIMHDWTDDRCREILVNIRAAMKRGYSKLLINDLSIPVKGATFFQTHSDLMVMSMAAARERTDAQWKDLLGSVGLRVEKTWTGDPDSESIIVAVLA